MSARQSSTVVLDGLRTPIGRLGGAFAEVDGVTLAASVIRRLVERNDVTPDEVLVGNVVQAGNGQNPARQAAVRGGLPMHVPALTLNDVCLSGLSAVRIADLTLRANPARILLVGGFDSASAAPRAIRNKHEGEFETDADTVDLLVRDGLWCAFEDAHMGELSDRENTRLRIGRAEQDTCAASSHARAAAAAAAGLFRVEIAPVPISDRLVGDDEGIRTDSTPQRLAGLKPAFIPNGTITAGNASQLSDGASALLIGDEEAVKARGHQPLCRVLGVHVVAGPDASLHLKPAAASLELLARFKMAARDIDLWEINEAFAGVAIASIDALAIDPDLVNVNGGAIALGHPLAASGPRLLLALAHELHRRGAELGIATMCGGGGQGIAVLVQNPGAPRSALGVTR